MRTGRKHPTLVNLIAVGMLLLLGTVPAAADEHGRGTLERLEREATGDALEVTDVAVTTHDGYDRVSFTVEGDGEPGWFIEYGPAAQQGSGDLVEVDGEALVVALRFMEMQGQLTEGSIDGPAGGVVNEVVFGIVFEGQHQFFVGVDEQLPYAAVWDGEASQVVVTVFHDDDHDDGEVPVGGVDAGAGGAAAPGLGWLAGLIGMLVLTAGLLMVVRRARAT